MEDETPRDMARAMIECTRAILRARAETELTDSVCRALAHPGPYAQARIAFAEAPENNLDASPSVGDSRAGCLSIPLVIANRRIAVLTVRTRNARALDADETAALEALAKDIAFGIERLREQTRGAALVTNERRLREIFEHAGVGITRIDENGKYIEVNQEFCKMLGYNRDELIGRSTRDITVPEDYGAGVAFRAEAGFGGATGFTGEKRYLHKNGTQVWVRRTMSRAYDEDGLLRDTVSVVEDITERKAAEEAVRRERVLLRNIIDALPDYIHVKDSEGRFQLGNKAWLDARRLRSEQVHGKTAFEVFPAAAAQRIHDQDREVMASGKAVIDQEQPIDLVGDDGSDGERWSATSKVPMRDESGRIVGIVGFSRDITDRRRMERERAMEHAVARVLSESRSVEETMPRLIKTICEAIGWAYGARWIWDAASSTLRRAEFWCEFEPQFEASDASSWKELGTRQGLLITAWNEQRATWFRDITQVERFTRKPSSIKFGFRSVYAFPILGRDERIGVMEFFGREVREPDEALLQVSGAVANQIGQFIRRKQAEESLQESEQQLRAVFENAEVGIAMTALDLRYLRINDKFCEIVGYAREELLRMRVSEVNLEENMSRMLEHRERMVRREATSETVEKELVRKDRSRVWVSMATTLIRASDGTPRYFITIIQDISESKRAEEQLKELAHYDTLTKLPNRALFYDRLAHGLAQAKRNKSVLAVLFVDVDRFKQVNDTFGHTGGDQLLKEISARLTECVRGEDTVGRLSGDEFAIVLATLNAAEDAGIVAKKIVDSMNKPFRLEGTELFVSASIGITVFPSDATEQHALIRNADVAMYRAKDLGRNNYQFYTPEMNTRTRETLNMAGELRRALERDEFVLHYQPKVSLARGTIVGAEALLRWKHPERGLVPPSDFIPLLEETGLIVQTGDWVLRAVCRQLRNWDRAGIRPIPVAINLSARQFMAPDLAQNIKRALEEHAIRAELLEVEITESSIMTNAEEAIRTLEYLDAMRVKVTIDDFGTGYSSLSYLKRFPLRALKIDRSFVLDITTDQDGATITQAVISMAHSLRLNVIAEGVETEAQLAFLSRYGCDEVQGYLFSRPVPGDECGAMVAEDRRLAVPHVSGGLQMPLVV